MPNIEIYFDDLTKEKQEELRNVLGDNGNYDLLPIAVIEYESCQTQEPEMS